MIDWPLSWYWHAQLLRDDSDLVEIHAKNAGSEVRFLVTGLTNVKHWSAIATH